MVVTKAGYPHSYVTIQYFMSTKHRSSTSSYALIFAFCYGTNNHSTYIIHSYYIIATANMTTVQEIFQNYIEVTVVL